MKFKYQKITTAAIVLVILVAAQFSVGVTFAERNLGASASAVVPAPVFGILTTHDNKPITVNGASAITGATIPTGAVVETPDKVGATIRLGQMGSICIAPNTKFTLEYDRLGNAASVKVNLTEGCIILRAHKDTAGTILSAQGNVGQIAATTGGTIDVCLKSGAAAMLNQGAASDAGAGASVIDCGAAGAAVVVPPVFPVAAVAAIAAGAVITPIVILSGSNPSP